MCVCVCVCMCVCVCVCVYIYIYHLNTHLARNLSFGLKILTADLMVNDQLTTNKNLVPTFQIWFVTFWFVNLVLISLILIDETK